MPGPAANGAGRCRADRAGRVDWRAPVGPRWAQEPRWAPEGSEGDCGQEPGRGGAVDLPYRPSRPAARYASGAVAEAILEIRER